MTPRVKVLILAGGRGKRLWPYSTERLPKQFLHINNKQSSFVAAVERAIFAFNRKDIFILATKESVLHIKRQLRGVGINPSNVLVNADECDTGIAIFLALRTLKENFGMRDDDVLVVLPADHFVEPLEKFKEIINKAVAAATAPAIVMLGKKPTEPREGLGYIVPAGDRNSVGVYEVDKVIEKPPLETARQLIGEGPCFWNLGMFIFPVGVMLAEFCKYFGKSVYQEVGKEAIAQARRMSIDTMVIERASGLLVIEAEFEWLDIGSWKAFYEMQDKDEKANANPLHQVLEVTQGSMVVGGGKPVVGIGLENIFLINHPDILLAVSESHIDALKKVMPLLEQKYPRLIKGDPMVSICTPVSSHRKYLSEAIESVLGQDYPLIEHVLLDAGSSADALELRKTVIALKSKHPNDGKVVDVVHHPQGFNGIYDAANAAVTEATGEIIGFLNSHDLLADSAAIRSIVEAMEKENADVCWADLVYVKENNTNTITRFWQSQRFQKGLFQKGWMPPNSAVFVRRSVFEKFGMFRTDLKVAGGYEFMLRVLEKEGVRNCYLPKIIVKMRDSGSPLLSRASTMVRGNAESYQAWKLNGLKVKPWFVFAKPFSKLNQLFNKHRAH